MFRCSPSCSIIRTSGWFEVAVQVFFYGSSDFRSCRSFELREFIVTPVSKRILWHVDQIPLAYTFRKCEWHTIELRNANKKFVTHTSPKNQFFGSIKTAWIKINNIRLIRISWKSLLVIRNGIFFAAQQRKRFVSSARNSIRSDR